MNCKQYQNTIDAYCEGTIGENLRTLIETHRKECPVCARFTSAYQLVYSSLKTAEQVTSPLGLRERILAIPDEEKVLEKMYPFPWASLVAELGAIAGVYVVGIIFIVGMLSHKFMSLLGVFQKIAVWYLQFYQKTLNVVDEIDLFTIQEQGFSILNKIVHLFVEQSAPPHILSYTVIVAIAGISSVILFYFVTTFMPPIRIHKRPQK
jgi:hypothetical protein